jgi:hypothetical protein
LASGGTAIATVVFEEVAVFAMLGMAHSCWFAGFGAACDARTLINAPGRVKAYPLSKKA